MWGCEPTSWASRKCTHSWGCAHVTAPFRPSLSRIPNFKAMSDSKISSTWFVMQCPALRRPVIQEKKRAWPEVDACRARANAQCARDRLLAQENEGKHLIITLFTVFRYRHGGARRSTLAEPVLPEAGLPCCAKHCRRGTTPC